MESWFLGVTVPFTDGVFSPIKLLLLLTELRGIGLCGKEFMVPFDLLFPRVERLVVDWLGCTDEEGVDMPLDWEFNVEEDLFRVGVVSLDSELFDALLPLMVLSILEPVFLRRNSFKKVIFDSFNTKIPRAH